MTLAKHFLTLFRQSEHFLESWNIITWRTVQRPNITMNVSDQHDALFDQPQGRAACQMHKWVVEQFNIIFILTTTIITTTHHHHHHHQHRHELYWMARPEFASRLKLSLFFETNFFETNTETFLDQNFWDWGFNFFQFQIFLRLVLILWILSKATERSKIYMLRGAENGLLGIREAVKTMNYF